MVSQSIFVLAALVCCLAVVALAQPLDDDMVMRAKRSPARRGGIRFTAARTRNAPTYASPEEDEAEEDEEEDAAAAPQKGGRGNSDEDEEEGGDGGAPPDYSKMGGKGATAIATSYSRGKGASSKSHAIAYGGQFSGGNFKHRY